MRKFMLAIAQTAIAANPALSNKRNRGPAVENETNHVWLD